MLDLREQLDRYVDRVALPVTADEARNRAPTRRHRRRLVHVRVGVASVAAAACVVA
ncbi:MAG: hypothetical protein QOI55_1481, partial [Actinomycetota bacterium]|nr:hypothetical protein [Actinomycetota bacterium]